MRPSKRELKCRIDYKGLMEDPLLLPDTHPIKVTRFHLDHIACYITRLKGFMNVTSNPLPFFRDTDLGACLSGSVYVMDAFMSNTGDDLFGYLWSRFTTAVDRFADGDSSISLQDLVSPFQELCDHLEYQPWGKQ